MNRDDVIKALKCCSGERYLCAECPVDKRLLDECVCGSFVMGQALQLIGNLEQIIFELENRLAECENGYSQTLAIERMKIIDLLATVERLSNVCKLNDKVGEDYIRVSKENRDLKEMLIKEHYDTEERTVCRIQEALKERIKGVYLDEGEMCAIIDEVAEKILKGNTEEEKK